MVFAQVGAVTVAVLCLISWNLVDRPLQYTHERVTNETALEYNAAVKGKGIHSFGIFIKLT